jgi:hypothetical protein
MPPHDGLSAAGAQSWSPLVTETISTDAIEALLSRRVPYVHVPRFLEPAWCEEIVRRFDAAIADLPDHQSLTMGPALLDALVRPIEVFVDSSNSEEYFTHVAQDAPRMRRLFIGGDDPLEKMSRAWSGAGWTRVPAAEDESRRYHPDAIWALRRASAPPHVDTYERDRQTALARFQRHFNYNVYMQNADSGGEFIIYNRNAADAPPGTPPALDSDLAAALLDNVERLEHRPAPGDLLIFDAMQYHEVTHVDGLRRPRIQVHSNLLADPVRREFLFFV